MKQLLTGTLLGWLLAAAITHLTLRGLGGAWPDRRVRLGPFLITGALATLLLAGSLR